MTDSLTGLPIAGATVRVLDLQTLTGPEGSFSVSGSRAETCNIDYYFSISITAPGYQGYQDSLYTTGVTGHYDVALEPLVTPTPTPEPSPPCAGDCDADGRVAVHELVAAVNIALGRAALATCAAADASRDGAVDVDEILAAVANGLAGCL